MRTLVWRLVVAACGFGGYGLAVRDFGGDLTAISQEASLAAGASYLVLAVVGAVRPALGWTWLVGAMATLLGLVWGSYLFLLSGSYDSAWSLMEHLVTPGLVVLDFCVVGAVSSRGSRVRWWWPVTWLVPPLVYLWAYVAEDWVVYDFLDPHDPGFPGW